MKDVINQIKNAEKVVWRHQGDQTHTALDSKESLSLANETIPQESEFIQKFNKTKQEFSDFYNTHNSYEPFNYDNTNLSKMSGVELSRHNPFAVFEMYMRDIYPHFKAHNNLIANAYYSGLIDRKQADRLIRVKTSARKIGERTADLLYLAGKTGREQDYKDALDKLHNFYHRILLKATQEYKALKALINEKAYPEFGTNYVEFYHDGKGAVDKLISEAKYFKESGKKDEFKGQVAGAFYRKDLGDIDLVWGEAGGGKSDGWGLAHILDKRKAELEAQGLSEGEV